MLPSEVPYHSLGKNTRPPTSDGFFYPLLLENQVIIQPRHNVRCHFLPVNRINKSLQNAGISRTRELNRCNRELNELTQTTTEVKLELTVKFMGLNPQPIPTSTQFKQRTFPSFYVDTSLQFTSTNEPPFVRRRGSMFL